MHGVSITEGIMFSFGGGEVNIQCSFRGPIGTLKSQRV